MSDRHRVRNFLPVVYLVLVLAGFFISTALGFIVLILGGIGFAMLGSALSQPADEEVTRVKTGREIAREAWRERRESVRQSD